MEANIYTAQGKEKGTVILPESVFGQRWNADLMHEVMRSMMSNTRAGTADTKGRGEVRGGGKKPWKQKGTGQARHGSIRSPIWVGGGVTHGPLAEKNYKRKINLKTRAKALFIALSQKARDGQILFVDALPVSGKTKDADAMFKALAKVKGFDRLGWKKPAAFVAVPTIESGTVRGMKNLPQISYGLVKDLNPMDVMSRKYFVVVNPADSIAWLERKATARTVKKVNKTKVKAKK